MVTVNAVPNSDKMNVLFPEQDIGKEPNLQMIPSNTAKVFHNDCRNLISFHITDEPVPIRSVKRSSSPSIIRVMRQILKPVLSGVFLKHFLLVYYAVAITLLFIVTGQSFI